MGSGCVPCLDYAVGVWSAVEATAIVVGDTGVVEGEEDVIYLDGVDVQAAERFIELNRGRPRICGFGVGGVGGGDVDVRSPSQVMKAVCELLRRNNITLEEAPPPPLVENLIRLMQELGEASEN